MKLHINDYQQSYIEYVLFMWANTNKKGVKMPLNTCKVIIKGAKQSTTSNGVFCTSDIELYVHMLNCPR